MDQPVISSPTLPPAESSDWHAGGDRGSIRGWVIAAIVVSVILHIGLYYAFNVVEFDRGTVDPTSRYERERLERMQISPDLLKSAEDLLAEIPDEPSELVVPEISDVPDLDLLEIQEQLPEKEVKLTPEVTEAQNFLAEYGEPEEGGAVAPAALVQALEGAAALTQESIASDMAQVRERMMEAGRASENQLLLDSGALDEGEVEVDDALFQQLDDADAGAANAGEGIEGFSSLDELLGLSGKLPRNLDPVLMPTDLVFGYNQVEVMESARLSMMKLGLLIQRNPESTFTIEGHTDSFGGDDYNMTLSERRAEAVKDWLVSSLRLDPDRIKTRGWGETKPIADVNGDQEAQGLNRRVEITIE